MWRVGVSGGALVLARAGLTARISSKPIDASTAEYTPAAEPADGTPSASGNGTGQRPTCGASEHHSGDDCC